MGHHYKCILLFVCYRMMNPLIFILLLSATHSFTGTCTDTCMHIIKTKLSIYHVCMYTILQTGWAVCRYVYTKYITSKVNLLSTAPAIIHSLVTFTVHVSAVMEIALHLPATSMHNHAENLGVHKRL